MRLLIEQSGSARRVIKGSFKPISVKPWFAAPPMPACSWHFLASRCTIGQSGRVGGQTVAVLRLAPEFTLPIQHPLQGIIGYKLTMFLQFHATLSQFGQFHLKWDGGEDETEGAHTQSSHWLEDGGGEWRHRRALSVRDRAHLSTGMAVHSAHRTVGRMAVDPRARDPQRTGARLAFRRMCCAMKS